MGISNEAENAIRWFSRIYLGGIPATITDDSAFLSFVCMVTATEVLSGYRYGDINLEKRFTDFISLYFPKEYKPFTKELYEFRNKMIHAFSTGRFALMHHASNRHFELSNGTVILNAEDFYAALLAAAQRYFAEVKSNPDLEKILVARLKSFGGGSIAVIAL